MIIRMGRVRSIHFPCRTCSKKCTTDVTCCDGCKMWFHSRCEQLSGKDMEGIGDSELGCICIRCCLGSNSDFDYEASIRRLSSYRSIVHYLTLMVKTECIFLRAHPFHFAESKPDNPTFQINQNAVNTLKMCDGNRSGCRPLYVDGDGNCVKRVI